MSELYSKLLKKNGEKQIIVAIEELSELQKELTKMLRGNGDKHDLMFEIADVYIMLEQMKLYFNIEDEDINFLKQLKNKRTEERLKEGKL